MRRWSLRSKREIESPQIRQIIRSGLDIFNCNCVSNCDNSTREFELKLFEHIGFWMNSITLYKNYTTRSISSIKLVMLLCDKCQTCGFLVAKNKYWHEMAQICTKSEFTVVKFSWFFNVLHHELSTGCVHTLTDIQLTHINSRSTTTKCTAIVLVGSTFETMLQRWIWFQRLWIRRHHKKSQFFTACWASGNQLKKNSSIKWHSLPKIC